MKCPQLLLSLTILGSLDFARSVSSSCCQLVFKELEDLEEMVNNLKVISNIHQKNNTNCESLSHVVNAPDHVINCELADLLKELESLGNFKRPRLTTTKTTDQGKLIESLAATTRSLVTYILLPWPLEAAGNDQDGLEIWIVLLTCSVLLSTPILVCCLLRKQVRLNSKPLIRKITPGLAAVHVEKWSYLFTIKTV